MLRAGQCKKQATTMNSFVFIISIVGMVLSFVTFWILLARNDRNKISVQAGSQYDLQELSTMAQSLTERIDILESILDAEVPDWRANNEQH
jgi:phage shock protein B